MPPSIPERVRGVYERVVATRTRGGVPVGRGRKIGPKNASSCDAVHSRLRGVAVASGQTQPLEDTMDMFGSIHRRSSSLEQIRLWALMILLVFLGLIGCRQHDLSSGSSDLVSVEPPAEAAKIAWASDRHGAFDIFVMAADGTDPKNLTQSMTEDSDPSWSSDGAEIAFYSARDGNYEIYVMDADGRNQTNLTNHPASDTAPTWSPDGSRIAFNSRRDGNDEIYVMDFDGKNLARLTSHGARDTAPAWSPDGSRILFFSERGGYQQIYVMNVDGSDQKNLSDSAANDGYPAWSPDGSQIVFHSDRSGTGEIYVLDADGTNLVQLTNDPNTAALAPSWSSDGKRIAFYTWSGPGTGEIIAIDADGRNPTPLTNGGSEDYDPAWSLGDTPDPPAPVLETSSCFRDGDFEDGGCPGGNHEE